MNILLLGNAHVLAQHIIATNDTITVVREFIAEESIIAGQFDWLISYGYRHILSEKVLQHFPNRAVNLHISYLPWNRGADPNLWSFLEDTPKGVTIHLMDAGIDTGNILAQKQLHFTGKNDTLATAYALLSREIEALFASIWPALRTGTIKARKQPRGGSYHRLKDKEPYQHLFDDTNWSTPVSQLRGVANKIST